MKVAQNFPGSLEDIETLILTRLRKLSPLGSTSYFTRGLGLHCSCLNEVVGIHSAQSSRESAFFYRVLMTERSSTGWDQPRTCLMKFRASSKVLLEPRHTQTKCEDLPPWKPGEPWWCSTAFPILSVFSFFFFLLKLFNMEKILCLQCLGCCYCCWKLIEAFRKVWKT